MPEKVYLFSQLCTKTTHIRFCNYFGMFRRARRASPGEEPVEGSSEPLPECPLWIPVSIHYHSNFLYSHTSHLIFLFILKSFYISIFYLIPYVNSYCTLRRVLRATPRVSPADISSALSLCLYL